MPDKPKKGPGGRPSRLKTDPEIVDRVLGFMGIGQTPREACEAAGVAFSTFRMWRHQWEKSDDPAHKEFLAGYKKARALLKARLLNKITRDRSWQSAAWMLERLDYERWGRKDRHEHSGPDGAPISHKHDVDPGALADKIASCIRRTAPSTSEGSTHSGPSGDDADGTGDTG